MSKVCNEGRGEGHSKKIFHTGLRMLKAKHCFACGEELE